MPEKVMAETPAGAWAFRNFDHEQDQDPGNSWAAWIFLFCATLLLPMWAIHAILVNLVRDERDAEIATLQQHLEQQIRILSPDLDMVHGVTFLAQLPFRKPRGFTTLATTLEARFPGAFRWVAWKNDGTLVDLPPAVMLPGKRIWEELTRTFLTRPESLGAMNGKLPRDHPAIARFQAYLGPQVRAEQFVKQSADPFEFTWMDKPCIGYIFQMQPVQLRAAPRMADFCHGVALIVRSDLVPDWYWKKLCLLSVKNGLLQGWEFAGFDTARKAKPLFVSSRRQVTARDLAPMPVFLASGRETGTQGSLLLRSLSLNPEGTRKVVLFREAGPIFARADRRRSQVNLVASVFLGILGLLFAAARQGAFSFVSLRWRIAGLFGLAILLPTTGIGYFYAILINNELERGKSVMQESLRQAAKILEARWKAFPLTYAGALVSRLEKRIARATAATAGDEAAMVRQLRRLVREKALTKCYLSDEKGDLAFVESQVPLEKDALSGIKFLVKLAFRDHIGAVSGSMALGDAFLEEAANMSGEKGGGVIRLSRPSEIKRYSVGKSEFNMMYLIPVIAGKPRVLMVEIETSILDKAFALREFKQNRFARYPPEGYPVELMFALDRHRGFYPPESPLWRIPAVSQALLGHEELIGEVSVDQEAHLFLVPKFPGNGSLKPLLTASLKPLQAKVHVRRNELLITATTAVVVAVILGLILAFRLIVPIRRIDRALMKVGGGDLGVFLPVIGKDELGRMSRSFNEMVMGLREREGLKAYVSPTVLDAVEKGTQNQETGRMIEATVLFSDVRSFTTLCEDLDEKDIIFMLNDYLGMAATVIEECGGRVDKFIGDSIMGVFHGEREVQARQAVRAALTMQRFMQEYNRRRAEDLLMPITVGVGINSGRVLLGNIGTITRKDLTVIGNNVNLAARLEGASKEGKWTQIVLSESTWGIVKNEIEAEEMTITSVKGKNQRVRMFEVIRPTTLNL
jgi:class 3 adenylate cyclase